MSKMIGKHEFKDMHLLALAWQSSLEHWRAQIVVHRSWDKRYLSITAWRSTYICGFILQKYMHCKPQEERISLDNPYSHAWGLVMYVRQAHSTETAITFWNLRVWKVVPPCWAVSRSSLAQNRESLLLRSEPELRLPHRGGRLVVTMDSTSRY